ncbi:hypothetical protein GW17_00008234 [Ensete ventricosum]|nr:hypothetical protein GW17_00008234 [Ensete ventricosum]
MTPSVTTMVPFSYGAEVPSRRTCAVSAPRRVSNRPPRLKVGLVTITFSLGHSLRLLGGGGHSCDIRPFV